MLYTCIHISYSTSLHLYSPQCLNATCVALRTINKFRNTDIVRRGGGKTTETPDSADSFVEKEEKSNYLHDIEQNTYMMAGKAAACTLIRKVWWCGIYVSECASVCAMCAHLSALCAKKSSDMSNVRCQTVILMRPSALVQKKEGKKWYKACWGLKRQSS